ncbi:MAG: glycosyltransferase family 4 protein [Reichenbachiella sp.]|uniref:glycosyltransferase family 4 protein n=1 Tax=Reichenbachiella sp. TaxID=2184521 RepID=UPI0029660CD3|nr:glycosyltransferase family 4 protein [Reichenbachiella sp.]MDW3208245.1 glycosyltransferase family 4 protein [Reichenbachiella sp.]
MNILILSKDYPPTIGGVETYSYHVAEGLSKNHDVTVVSFQGKHYINSWKDTANVIRINSLLNNELFKAVSLLLNLLIILSSKKYDLIYATTWKVSVPFALLNILFKIKFLIVCHGAEITRHKHKRPIMKMMKWVLNKADSIFTVSTFTRDKVIEYSKVSPDKIHVIPNGVDFSKLVPLDKNESRNKLGFAKDQFVFLTVSRVDSRKGHDIVIKAIKSLIVKKFNVLYVIVGDGPSINSLKELTENWGLQEQVKFAGFVSNEELDEYYSASDVFVMLNTMKDDRDFEGFGLVFAEAGYYGLPLIGGNNAGPKEVIIDSISGYLVNDVIEELAEKLSLLYSDRNHSKKLGEEAKKISQKEFSLKKLIERIELKIQTL